MFELLTLGRLTLRESGSVREIRSVTAQPKRMALLLDLALGSGGAPRPRDAVLARMWPELDEERARRALNQAVYFLRRSLGTDAILTAPDGGVALGPSVSVDALGFEEAIRDARFDAALELYLGDLAPAFHPSVGVDFETWLDDERVRLRHQAIDAARGRAEASIRAGRPRDAARVLGRAREWAPFDPALVQERVKALMAAGEGAAATAEVERWEGRLAAELEAEPEEDRALRALLEAGAASATPQGIVAPGAGAGRAPTPEEASPAEPAGTPAIPLPGGGIQPKRSALGARRVRSRVLLGARSARPRVLLGALLVAALALLPWPGDGTVGRDLPTAGRDLSPAGQAGSPPPRPRLLVLPFRNETDVQGLDVLDRMAADWIVQGALDAGLTEVVPFETALSLVSGSVDSSVVGTAAAVGADLFVSGSIYARGDSLLLRARITDVSEGALVSAVEATAPLDDPSAAVTDLGERVTGRIAVHLDPTAQVAIGRSRRPPRYEAYAVFSEALDAYREPRMHRWPGVAALFEQAATMDTTFTAARLWAAQAWINADRDERAEAHVRYLEARRESLTPWERALLSFHRAGISGTREEFYLANRRLAAISGDDVWRARLAHAAFYAGRYREAVRVVRTIDPARTHDLAPTAFMEANALHVLGEYEEQHRVWDREGRPADWEARFSADAALGRAEPGLTRLEASLEQATPAHRAGARLQAARELRVHGHDSLAAQVTERALATVREAPPGHVPEMLRLEVLFDAGRWEEVVALGEPMIAREPDFRMMGLMGAAYARLERRHDALAIAQKLRALPNRHGEQTLYETGIHAHLGDIPTALATLERAFELGLAHHQGLHVLPLLEPLRDDPTFRALIGPKG